MDDWLSVIVPGIPHSSALKRSLEPRDSSLRGGESRGIFTSRDIYIPQGAMRLTAFIGTKRDDVVVAKMRAKECIAPGRVAVDATADDGMHPIATVG